LGGEAAYGINRLATGDLAGTAAEAYVPDVAAWRNLIEKQTLLVWPNVLAALLPPRAPRLALLQWAYDSRAL